MTNAEMYKSAEAKSEAFNKFCSGHNCGTCPLLDPFTLVCRGRNVWETMNAYPVTEEEWKEIADNRPVRVLASAIKGSNVEVVNDPGRKYAIDRLCDYATNLENNCVTIWQEGNKTRLEVLHLGIEIDHMKKQEANLTHLVETIEMKKLELENIIGEIYKILKGKFDMVGFSTNEEQDIFVMVNNFQNKQ